MSMNSKKLSGILLAPVLMMSVVTVPVIAEEPAAADETPETSTTEVTPEESTGNEEVKEEVKDETTGTGEADEGTGEEETPAEETPAEDEEGEPGATVYADEDSPSGYTVDFVFDGTQSEKEVTKVTVTGPFNYTNKFNEGVADEDVKNVTPYEYENGMYASNCHGDGSGLWSYTAELTDEDNDKIFEVEFPITSGSFGYTYTVTYADGTSETMADPANTPDAEGKINEEGNHNSGDTTTSVVKGHWDAEKQSESPNMDYVLPADEADQGTLTYVEYTNVAGETSHIGVYTPAGYDPEREEPYKTIYMSHGAGGDEQDWFHMGSVDDIMDNMVAAGEAEEAIIVTMDNTALGWDYTKTLPNIVDIIIPLVEENYNVSTDPEDRAMLGLSAGAMTTTMMYRTYPTEFGYFGMFSGSNLESADVEIWEGADQPIVMVTTGTTDFASSRWGGAESSFSSERLDAWLDANVPDNYWNNMSDSSIYVQGSHDWFEWPQSFAEFITEVAWKNADGTEKEDIEEADATYVEEDGATIHFVYDDTDVKDAVSVTVAGNFQWYPTDEIDQYVALGDNSGMSQYRAEEYEDGMYNASGLNGQESYELTQTSSEHFELELTIPVGNLYFYDYTVTYADGTTVTITDPSNPAPGNDKDGADAGHSLIYTGSADDCTPGQEYIYARTDGKTGTRQYVPYVAADGSTQYIEVYLPYGYDESKTYPTLYVSHGGGGNEAEWMTIGAAANILDNLIAEGTLAPTVMVTMDNTYFGWDYEQIEKNMLECIIPYMEKNYSVSKSADDRAFCGLSMGSMTTNQIAKDYPNEFKYFGSFSGGSTDLDASHYDVEALNNDVLYLTAGCIDMAYNNTMGISSVDYMKMYDELGVEYDFDLLYGAHDWGVWRESLTNFAKDYLWEENISVVLDGKVIDSKYYTVGKDGKVTLTDEFIATLKDGKYTMQVITANGEKTENSTITVKTDKDEKKSAGVNTGDTFHAGILGGTIAACAALIAAAYFALTRKH